MTDTLSARNAILVEALKEAMITAAVAAALMIPLIGLHAKTQVTGLVIETRFGDVAIAVGLVFLGRYALVLTQRAMAWHRYPLCVISSGRRPTRGPMRSTVWAH